MAQKKQIALHLGLVVLGCLLGIGARNIWLFGLGIGNDPRGTINAYLRNEGTATAAFLAVGVAVMYAFYGLSEFLRHMLARSCSNK